MKSKIIYLNSDLYDKVTFNIIKIVSLSIFDLILMYNNLMEMLL